MPGEDGGERRRTAIRAWRAVERATAPGDPAYERQRHLPRLVPIGPDELADATPRGRRRVLFRLARALRGERARGRAGHWTYDLDRHLGLIEAYRAERAALEDGRERGASTLGRATGVDP
jgi:hypothetical protein